MGYKLIVTMRDVGRTREEFVNHEPHLRNSLSVLPTSQVVYQLLYNNQINVRALIGQSAVGYCAGKPTEKSRVF